MNPLWFCLAIVLAHSTSVGAESKGDKTSKKGKAGKFAFPGLPKDIVVVGGGIAGLTAARTLTAHVSNFTVRVYEAQKNRYGGRIWTDKLTNMKAKGPEVDLGGAKLSMVSKDNPLIELARSFELKMTSLDKVQFLVPWKGQSYSGDDFKSVSKTAVQVLYQALNNSQSLAVEVSVQEAVDKVLTDATITDEDSASAHFVKCLPSYIIQDYSTKHYKAEDLDIGYNTILLDGMGELVDRIVSGSMDEPPLHVALNKAVRQIKIDDTKGKAIVRFRDGSQTETDIVIVAVPVAIIAGSDLLFEPDLPPKYKLAANQITTSKFNKLILEFEEAFWPTDMDVFVRAVQTSTERGRMQVWLNVHKLTGQPVLIAFFLEEAAAHMEGLSDTELEQAARAVLAEMFGEATLAKGGNIVGLQRSRWSSEEFSKGASTYTGLGADPKLWDTFAEPLCPYVYFAGEYTSSAGLGSIHGAYNSGIRVGNQIINKLCEKKMEEERRRIQKEKERKRMEEEKKRKGGEKAGKDGSKPSKETEAKTKVAADASKEEL